MRFKTTWLLFLLVATAGAALWWLEGQDHYLLRRHHEVTQAFRLDPERVTELRLVRGEATIWCRKEEGVWRLLEPVNARADAGEMDRILSLLRESTRGEVITPRERREAGLTLRDYGLERPHALVEWTQDQVRRVVWIGREAPLGESLYVMQEGAENIVAVSSLLMTAWPEHASSLRDRRLFHGDPRRTYRVEVRRPEGFLQIVRAEDGTWRIQQPLPATADRLAVRQLIDRIYEWRIADFAAETMADASVYGLAETAVQVSVWTEGHEAGQTVLLGAPRDGRGDEVYALHRSGQSVFSVPSSFLVDALLKPNDLRDRVLVPLKVQGIGTVRVVRGDQSLTLQRHGTNQWQLVQPKIWPADTDRVQALLEAWTSARITQFVDDALTNGTRYGIGDDALKITFETRPVPSPTGTFTNGNGAPLSVSVRASDTVLDDDLFWVRRAEEPYLYAIPKKVQQVTSWNPLYFRSRSVVRVDPVSVWRILQTIDDTEQLFERDVGGAAWRAASGPLDAETATELNRVVDTLSDLQAESFVLDDPKEWSAFGLHEPSVVWTLNLSASAGAGLGRVVMIGSVQPDGRAYARTLGEEVVFVLSPSITRVLTRPLFKPVDPMAEEGGE